MKKFSLFSLFFVLFLFGFQGGLFAQSAIWNGTVSTVFRVPEQGVAEISTAEQLAGLAYLVSIGRTFAGTTFRLTQDIVLNDTTNWQNWETQPPARTWAAIGHSYRGGFLGLEYLWNYFAGVFDGQGHDVIGVYINSNYRNQGLFGIARYGTIRNVGVTHSFVRGAGATAGLLGWGWDVDVENSFNSGRVIGTGYETGGLVGTLETSGTLTNSRNIGIVSGTGNVGGLVGLNRTNSVIYSSFNNGNVSGLHHIGGVAGRNESVINNSFSAVGAMSGSHTVGGLVGYSYSAAAHIRDSYSTSTVTVAGDRVGRLIGVRVGGGTIERSYFLEGGSGVGQGAGTGIGTGMSLARFNSGEVAHLLQGTQANPIWGHTVLGGAELPQLIHFAPTALQVRRVSFASTNPVHNSTQFFLNGSTLTLPTLNRIGFILNWRDAHNQEFTSTSQVVADLTLTAHWIPIQYTITFNSAGGSAVTSITQNFGTTITAPANPTRANHTFAGWSPALPATMPAGGLAVTAQWVIYTTVQREPDFSVKLGPNPIQDELIVTITGASEYIGKTVRISVFDLNGRRFATETIKINGVYDEKTVAVSSLSAGVCVLVLEVEGFDAKRLVFTKVER